MAKFYGKIGYAVTEKTAPGVFVENIVERDYYGELGRNIKRNENSGYLNDNITISNEISILSDPYAISNFHCMKYVIYMGTKWKINSVEVQYPRLILNIGGVYND